MYPDPRVVFARTIPITEKKRKYPGIAFGDSPRAGIHLLKAARSRALINERDYVIPDDIKDLAVPVLAHRLLLDPESEIEVLQNI